MFKKIKNMVSLQDTLNLNTNGPAWVKGVTKENRSINWHRAIYMEIAEAIDSLNWKHWKALDSKEDMKNVEIEVVDVWHFIMSQAITDTNGNVKEATALIYKEFIYVQNTIYKQITLIDQLEEIARVAINGKNPIREFFIALELMPNLDMETMYSLYIGKNCLNAFRQDYGYKEVGVYIKIWNGKEDNVYMQEIIEKNRNITFDSLYKQLEDIYIPILKENR